MSVAAATLGFDGFRRAPPLMHYSVVRSARLLKYTFRVFALMLEKGLATGTWTLPRRGASGRPEALQGVVLWPGDSRLAAAVTPQISTVADSEPICARQGGDLVIGWFRGYRYHADAL